VFAAVRFLIGAAEAGAYPGIIYYLTLWFPKRYRVQALALMTIGSPLGNMFGSLFGGLLLNLDGVLGLGGRQWVFIATGVPAVVLFALIAKYLPNGPQDARFINERESAGSPVSWHGAKSRKRCTPIRCGFCSTGGCGPSRPCIR
jgi:MFS family permease